MTSLASRYHVVSELGHGGMGVVMYVYDRERGEHVAQKRIRDTNISRMLRFKREFRAVERLIHPHLVRLYELGEDEHGLFYTMEVVHGVDLLEYCRGPRSDGDSASTTQLSVAGTPTITRPRTASSSSAHVDMTVTTMDVSDSGADTAPGSIPAARRSPAMLAPGVLSRLTRTAPQILEALDFLHSHGLVHRDLKPRNILVTADHAVKLLDFGILADLQAGEELGGVVGTLAYMAPEQLRGEIVSPAADLYSLGALLFRILTGHHVFEGSREEVKRKLLSEPAPRLRSLIVDAPAWLDDICTALLAKDPESRPGVATLVQELLPRLGSEAPSMLHSRRVHGLVGRRELQARLRWLLGETQGGSFHVVALRGDTGAGKTALADWLAAAATAVGTAVLRGRGRPSERVPFNAVDGVVDALALRLADAPIPPHERDALEAQMDIAAPAFPVLGEVPAATQRPATASQHTVFDALTALVEALAARAAGVLILVDDLQWADRDSLALLGHLVRRAPASVAILATERTDVGDTDGGAWLANLYGATRLDLPPLPTDAIASIIVRVARAAGADPQPAIAARLARACGGRPYLAEVAGRALARGVTDTTATMASVVSALIEAASPLGQSVLALLVAMDGWTRIADLAEMAETNLGAIDDELTALAQDGLIRRTGAGPSGSADCYHDAVRAAASSVLDAAVIAQAHGAVADFLAAQRQTQRPSSALGHHVRALLGASREAEAAALAVDAAERAERKRAFALAADMYELALTHPGDRREALMRRHARVLGLAGRYRDCAVVWRAVADAATGDDDDARAAQIDAALHEARALMAANDIAGGHQRLQEALAADGRPPLRASRAASLIEVAGFWRGPKRSRKSSRRAADSGDPSASAVALRAASADRDIRIGELIGYFDPIAGVQFLRRLQREFDRGGDRASAAWVDYLFAYFAAFASRRAGSVPLAERYLRAGADRLRDTSGLHPEIQSLPHLVTGVLALRDARWDDARADLDRAVDRLQAAGLDATFGYLFTAAYRAQVDLFSQQVTRGAATQNWLRQAASGTTESAILCHLEFTQIQLDTYLGRFDLAAALGDEVIDAWPEGYPTFQRFLAEIWRALPEIYRGDCHRTRRRLAEIRVALRRLRPLSNMYCGATGAIIALVEANAMRTGDRGSSQRRIAKLARLCARAPRLLHAGALRARAYVAERPERQVALLRAAAAEATRWGQPLDAAIAQYQCGLRLGGSEGEALAEQARATVGEIGASEALLYEDAGYR